jgi:hypothetical protein
MVQTACHINLPDHDDFLVPRWIRAIEDLHRMLRESAGDERAFDLGHVTLRFVQGQVRLEHGPLDPSIENRPPLSQAQNEVVECDNSIGRVLPALVRVASDQDVDHIVINFPDRDQLVLWRQGDEINYAVMRRNFVAA